MSANQLAEYLIASPARRQTILRNARYAPTFLVIRYQAAKTAIKRYLSDDVRNERILSEALVELDAIESGDQSAFRKNDAQLCVEAIKSFQSISKNKEISGITFRQIQNQLPNLEMEGVEISINPDLVAYKPHRSGQSIGGIIFQTSKAVAAANWRADHSRNVSTLIWMLAEKHMSSLGDVDRKLCMTVDVFGKAITPAPLNYKRKLNDLEAACAEISALWDRISAPPDFEAA